MYIYMYNIALKDLLPHVLVAVLRAHVVLVVRVLHHLHTHHISMNVLHISMNNLHTSPVRVNTFS